MNDTKSASEYKPVIEVGTVIHIINAKQFPKRDEYKRWDGEKWVDITEEMKERKHV